VQNLFPPDTDNNNALEFYFHLTRTPPVLSTAEPK